MLHNSFSHLKIVRLLPYAVFLAYTNNAVINIFNINQSQFFDIIFCDRSYKMSTIIYSLFPAK